MSRGPGTWQQAMLTVTDSGLATTVRAMVLDSVSEPARSDYVSARRAAKTLAMAGRLTALYVYGCPGCGAIQRTGRHGCCASTRPMLGVAPMGSRPPFLAPAPAHRVPSWVCAAPPLQPGLRYSAASLPAVLDLVIQRGMERVRSGEIKVGAADLIAALRLRQQVEAASQPDAGQWAEFTVVLLDVAREQMGPGQFRDFLGAVRNSPAFMALSA